MLELQEISDRLEIQDLTWRYAELIDSGDFERLRDDVFTDDAFIDYTELGGPAGDLSRPSPFSPAMALFNGYQHLTANHRISIDGDRAMGRIMCFNPMGIGPKAPDLAGHVYFCGLWYVDEYRRSDRGWRIARRYAELSYKHNLPPGWD